MGALAMMSSRVGPTRMIFGTLWIIWLAICLRPYLFWPYHRKWQIVGWLLYIIWTLDMLQQQT